MRAVAQPLATSFPGERLPAPRESGDDSSFPSLDSRLPRIADHVPEFVRQVFEAARLVGVEADGRAVVVNGPERFVVLPCRTPRQRRLAWLPVPTRPGGR